jgi:sugar transferase (PEP-CTERM system associated)
MIRVLNQYVSLKGVLLILLEALIIALAPVSAARLRFWGSQVGFESYVDLPDFAWQVLIFVIAVQICFYYNDLYRLSAIRGRNDGLMRIISFGQSLGAACLLLGLVYFVLPALLLGRGIFFIAVGLVPAFVTVSRAALDRIWQAAAPRESVLIVGTGELAATLAAHLLQRGDLNMTLAGFADVARRHQTKAVGAFTSGTQSINRRSVAELESTLIQSTVSEPPIFGPDESLDYLVDQHHITRIVIALEDRRNVLPTKELVRLRVRGVRVEDVHSMLAALTGRVWLETVKPSWFVFTDGFHRSLLTRTLKRTGDLLWALVGMALSLPIMLLVAVAVRLDSNGPVLYRQRRVGLRGRLFEVLKFRSMRLDAEAGTGARWATENDPRVTRVGRFTRKYRLDELPQFWNVIRGDMSFVGPRPERPEFVDQLREVIPYYDERHSIRPGLTGWAQVQYSYGASVEDAMKKLEYDLFYLKNMSLTFDVAIVFQTIGIVLGGHGGPVKSEDARGR